MEKRKRWGARPAVRFMGQGDKAARARTCTTVLVPLQRIFGFGRHPSPPGWGSKQQCKPNETQLNAMLKKPRNRHNSLTYN